MRLERRHAVLPGVCRVTATLDSRATLNKGHAGVREKIYSSTMKSRLATLLIVFLAAAAANAQQTPTPPPATPYGAPISIDAAKRVMAAAEAEATKNHWSMAIVILDSTGHIAMLEKLDNTQYGSITVAEDKAHS